MTIDEFIVEETGLTFSEIQQLIEEFKVYKKALEMACSQNNTNPICATEEYKNCCKSLGSCGECWGNMYLQKARGELNA